MARPPSLNITRQLMNPQIASMMSTMANNPSDEKKEDRKTTASRNTLIATLALRFPVMSIRLFSPMT